MKTEAKEQLTVSTTTTTMSSTSSVELDSISSEDAKMEQKQLSFERKTDSTAKTVENVNSLKADDSGIAMKRTILNSSINSQKS